MTKIISLENLQRMDIDSIIQLYKQGHKLDSICSLKNTNNIKQLATGCIARNQLDIIELLSTGSGGVPPYQFNIYVDNILLGSMTGTTTQTEKSWLYQIGETPNMTHNYRTEVIDSTLQAQSDSCDIFVGEYVCTGLGIIMSMS